MYCFAALTIIIETKNHPSSVLCIPCTCAILACANLDEQISINIFEAHLKVNKFECCFERMQSLRQIRHIAISWNALIYSRRCCCRKDWVSFLLVPGNGCTRTYECMPLCILKWLQSLQRKLNLFRGSRYNTKRLWAITRPLEQDSFSCAWSKFWFKNKQGLKWLCCGLWHTS